MAVINQALQILVENSKTFRERNEIYALTESEATSISNTLVSKLYASTVNKAHVDFDDIPNSKGDITKYKGFTSMMESISCLKSLAEKSGTKIPDIDTVDKAIANIVAFRDHFEKGYKLDKQFIALHYNALVACCVEATSILISSYVDFIRRVDTIEFTLANTKTSVGGIAIQNLELFNKSVSNGEFAKVMNTVIKSNSEGFSGAEAVLITGALIAGVTILVTSLREIIFHYYHNKMKISDYLALQAHFLEMHKSNLEANSGIPAKKKMEIMKKQEKTRNKLIVMSDKLRVANTMSDTKVRTELKKETSEWKLSDTRSQSAVLNNNGFELL